MQDMLRQVIEEGYEGGSGSLHFSCAEIELTLAPATVYEGAFRVYGSGADTTSGFVVSSDPAMECLTGTFYGGEEVIGYRFDASHKKAGQVVGGSFHFICTHGEYDLPFRVKIEEPVPVSSQGEIRSLTQFSALAKENWPEAVRLFYEPGFLTVLEGEDSRYLALYRGFSGVSGNQRNVDEFLISCGQKQRISYYVEGEILQASGGFTGVSELSLTLKKDGWGYTGLQVLAEGTFVFTEKNHLTDDDFLGNQCVLPIYIDGQQLHRGRNFGRVILRDTCTLLEVPVVVSDGKVQHAFAGGLSGRNAQKDQLYASLTELYLKHRLSKIGGAVWLQETSRIVERLVAMDEQDVTARLFQAQLLIAQDRRHEASWVLTHSYEMMERGEKRTPEHMAYYLYLTTRINQDKEYFRKTAAQIEDIYHRDKTSWRLAWLVLATSSRLRSQTSEKWDFLKRQFNYGCISPVWYTEALLCLNNNPALLRRLEELEIQVLFYGVRKEALSDELAEQLLYLTSRKREYSAVLTRLLMRLYEQKQDERILQEVCAQLIKGGRTDAEAFGWYEKGVESELRITRLYEYYMLSMDLSKEYPISRKAMMYFAWQTNLDYEHAAYLYYYILKNQSNLEELALQYRERMEHFVVDQLMKHHINPHLAYLYQHLVTQPMLSEELAVVLAGYLFTWRITTEIAGMNKVLVCRADRTDIREYPVTAGCAYVPLYQEREEILFEDGEGNRYAGSISWKKEKLMNHDPLLHLTARYVGCGKTDAGFDQLLWDVGSAEITLSSDTVERGKYLLEQEELSDSVKGRIQMALLSYYRKNKETKVLDDFPAKVRWDILDEVSLGETIRNLVLWGNLEKAYEGLVYAGGESIDPGVLVKLCDWRLETRGQSEDPVLTAAAWKALTQNKYSSQMLQYLASYLQGRTSMLLRVLQGLSGYSVDMSQFLARILVQMLFTGEEQVAVLEVFRAYLKRGTDPAVEMAVLSACARRYMLQEEKQELLVYDRLLQLYQGGQVLTDLGKLACLKAAAKDSDLFENSLIPESERKDCLRSLLTDMLRKGIFLGWFKKLPGCEDLLALHKDKTVIECLDRQCSKITVHYTIHKAAPYSESIGYGEKLQYKETMHMISGGIFYKEFVLFAGETLEYYYTKESERQTQVTKRMRAQADELWEEAGYHNRMDAGSQTGRYTAINCMAESESLGDYEQLDRQLEEYYHREYLGKRLFTLR